MLVYKPREKNVIQEILQEHFKFFEQNYDTQYSRKYDKYRIIHIKEAVKRFIECGDYSKGIARIKCTNTHCGHEMKVIAVITNSQEVMKMLKCLKRNNAPPFDKVEIKAS